MALSKIALSLLGTIAMTAGTLLAVAEPGSKPLPAVATAPGKCTSCPGSACAGLPTSCSGTVCTAAAKAEPACTETSCPTATTAEKACSEKACPAAVDAAEPQASHSGPIQIGNDLVVSVAGGISTLSTSACSTTACKGCLGHQLSLTQTDAEAEEVQSAEALTTVVYFKDCPACTASNSVAACPAPADKAAAVSVVATACEAKPACATEACAATACRKACTHDAVAAVSSADCCAICKSCVCGACSCEKTASAPPAPIEIRPLSADNAPGLVRLTHVVTSPVIEFNEHEDYVPTGREYYTFHTRFHPLSHNQFDYVPTGSEFAPLAQHIRLSSHATPGVPAPPRAYVARAEATSPARNPVEGTWTRKVENETITFSIENGRIHGTFGQHVRFSGTCSVSEDGQIFGLMDEFEGLGALVAVAPVDQPFAVRFRLDGDDLILKDLRCAGLPTESEEDKLGIDKTGLIRSCHAVLNVACGRYTQENEL